MCSSFQWPGDRSGELHDKLGTVSRKPQPFHQIVPFPIMEESRKWARHESVNVRPFEVKDIFSQEDLKSATESAKEVGAFLDRIIDSEGIGVSIVSEKVGSEDKKTTVVKKAKLDGRDQTQIILKPSREFAALGRSVYIPEDLFLDPGDSVYLEYFVEELDEVFSLGILSGIRPLWNMLSCALDHHALRYTLIAVSAWLADGIAGRSRERSVANLRKAVPMIQNAITATTLDDGHRFAVFLLAYLSVVRGDLKGAILHVGGFYRILRHCHILREDGTPNLDHTPLAMVLWRIAVRIDNIIGFARQRAVFPVTNIPDSFHLNWIRDFDNPDRPGTIEWALAQFALDDLANRAVHLAARSMSIQRYIATGESDGIEELNVELDLAFLVRDLETWKCRRILREAESRERARSIASPSGPSLKFLHYEPLTFVDEAYAILLIQYFTCRIQLSLIANPQLGPFPRERHLFAVELCRVYAGIGGLRKPGLSGLVVGLFYASLALTDKTYPLEYIWIQGRLRDVDKITGYSAGAQVIRIMDEIMQFRSPAPFWDYFFRIND